MLVSQLFCIAIKTANVEETRRFCMGALGTTLANRSNSHLIPAGLQHRAAGRLFDPATHRRFAD
jgi:hypothetical protein